MIVQLMQVRKARLTKQKTVFLLVNWFFDSLIVERWGAARDLHFLRNRNTV